MSDSESSSALPPSERDPKGKQASQPDEDASETAPLLTGSSATPRYDGENDGNTDKDASEIPLPHSPSKSKQSAKSDEDAFESAPSLSPSKKDRKGKQRAQDDEDASESTPLLTGSSTTPRYDGQRDDRDADDVLSVASGTSHAQSSNSTERKSIRWPSVIAMIILSLLTAASTILAVLAPAAMEEYAKQATVVEPTNLSLESLTSNGVRARIQANFRLDGQRVGNEHVRRLGSFSGWLLRTVKTEGTKVDVYLPDFEDILLGSGVFPPLTVSIVEGENTAVDFVADLIPGNAEGIRAIANEWFQGKLNSIRLRGKADVRLKAGLIPLGTQTISESLVFEGNKLPTLPSYNITRLNFEEKPVNGSDEKTIGAEVTLDSFNAYPVSLDVPELGFEVLVPGCNSYDPRILVATAETSPVAVRPKAEVVVDAHGLIRELPDSLVTACPDSGSSPLDMFFKKYMHGEEATIYVRGQKPKDAFLSANAQNKPEWLADILSSITVPVAFPGRSFDNLIRNFSLSDVQFTLPDPLAQPGDPDANPKVSGTIEVEAALPSELNFSLDVHKVRANADVFYKKQKLGELNLTDWQDATSKQIPGEEGNQTILQIRSRIEDVPLNVTDADVLTDVIQALLFGGKEVLLSIEALVDVKVETILGKLVVKGVPAEGDIPLKPLPHGIFDTLEPQASDIEVVETDPTSVLIRASVNITNPTPYSAHIPFISVHVLCNGTVLGEVTAKNLNLTTGNNTNLVVTALWKPSLGGPVGSQNGRDLISQYLSGYNTSVTVKTHRNSIPSQPLIGEALSKINITVSAPRLNLPGGGEGEKEHFIRDAVFHVFSSTATFTLVSPLRHNTLYIERINATALYNHTEPMGRIEYNLPFAAPPGESQTPKLPVQWSLDSVGYGKLKEALGGRMKLDARAVVGVRVGQWTETVWYVGKGIGASVRV
ncbi:hypothetical protein V8F06_005799 [Rhypophila decipiens]